MPLRYKKHQIYTHFDVGFAIRACWFVYNNVQGCHTHPCTIESRHNHCIETCAVNQYELMSLKHRANTARSLLHFGNLLTTSFRARCSNFMYKNPFEHSYLLTRLNSLQLSKAHPVVKAFNDCLAFHLLWTRTQTQTTSSQSIQAPEAKLRPIMSSNKIIQKVDLKTVTKGNQAVRLSAATVTQSWTRPAVAVQSSKDGFAKAVQNAKKPLPDGTTEIAMR